MQRSLVTALEYGHFSSLTPEQLRFLEGLEQLRQQGGWHNLNSLCTLLHLDTKAAARTRDQLISAGLVDEITHSVDKQVWRPPLSGEEGGGRRREENRQQSWSPEWGGLVSRSLQACCLLISDSGREAMLVAQAREAGARSVVLPRPRRLETVLAREQRLSKRCRKLRDRAKKSS